MAENKELNTQNLEQVSGVFSHIFNPSFCPSCTSYKTGYISAKKAYHSNNCGANYDDEGTILSFD